MQTETSSHNMFVGYLLWLVGFTGSHRFYFGRPISGTLYFFTFGLLGIGWLIDVFLIPSMDREADYKYNPGIKDYNIAWILLTFLGLFGVHRFYMEKWFTGLVYLCTGGLFGMGYVYDYWTINEQLRDINRRPTFEP